MDVATGDVVDGWAVADVTVAVELWVDPDESVLVEPGTDEVLEPSGVPVVAAELPVPNPGELW